MQHSTEKSKSPKTKKTPKLLQQRFLRYFKIPTLSHSHNFLKSINLHLFLIFSILITKSAIKFIVKLSGHSYIYIVYTYIKTNNKTTNKKRKIIPKTVDETRLGTQVRCNHLLQALPSQTLKKEIYIYV